MSDTPSTPISQSKLIASPTCYLDRLPLELMAIIAGLLIEDRSTNLVLREPGDRRLHGVDALRAASKLWRDVFRFERGFHPGGGSCRRELKPKTYTIDTAGVSPRTARAALLELACQGEDWFNERSTLRLVVSPLSLEELNRIRVQAQPTADAAITNDDYRLAGTYRSRLIRPSLEKWSEFGEVIQDVFVGSDLDGPAMKLEIDATNMKCPLGEVDLSGESAVCFRAIEEECWRRWPFNGQIRFRFVAKPNATSLGGSVF